MQACRPLGCRGCHGMAVAPPDFGRSVNPISTRWTDYVHLITIDTPGFSDPPTALGYFHSTLRWDGLLRGYRELLDGRLRWSHSGKIANQWPQFGKI